MRLAATELGYEREVGRRVDRLARKSPKNHTGVIGQRTGKAGAREELFRLGIILGRGTSDNVFEGDGEFVGAERAPFANLAPWDRVLVPGLNQPASRGISVASSMPAS